MWGEMDLSTARPDADPRTSVLDEAVLDAFVREHHDRLNRLARLVCIDSSEAGDAVQSAFEQAWRRRATLQDPAALRSWLDRIVVREAIRQDRRRRSPFARLFGQVREIPPEVLDSRGQQHESMTDLRIAFESLPADQRAVIALHLQMGYSIAETAAVVEAPVETVRSRLRVGRERLRQRLEVK